jgi:hypothetical protein
MAPDGYSKRSRMIFRIRTFAKPCPMASYDIGQNQGWVKGMSADAAAFVMNGIRQWWGYMGKPCYSKAPPSVGLPDGDGSVQVRNVSSPHQASRLSWRMELHHRAFTTPL